MAINILAAIESNCRSFRAIIDERAIDRQPMTSRRGCFADCAQNDARILVIFPRTSVVAFAEIPIGMSGIADELVIGSHLYQRATR